MKPTPIDPQEIASILNPTGKRAKAVKPMTRKALSVAIGKEMGHLPGVADRFLSVLEDIATKEMKETGAFVIPGVSRLRTRMKPATQVHKRIMFGKEMDIKAKPARRVVKSSPVARLKKAL